MLRMRNSLIFSRNQLYSNLKELIGVEPDVHISLDYNFIDSISVLPISRQSNDLLVSNNLKVENLKRNLERAKNYKVSIKDRYPIGSSQGKDADTDLLKAEQQLNAEVEKLPYNYDKAFRQVIEQYEIFIQKEKDLDIKNMEYKMITLKYKLGSASKLELETARIAFVSAEIEKTLARVDYVSSTSVLESVLKGTN